LIQYIACSDIHTTKYSGGHESFVKNVSKMLLLAGKNAVREQQGNVFYLNVFKMLFILGMTRINQDYLKNKKLKRTAFN